MKKLSIYSLDELSTKTKIDRGSLSRNFNQDRRPSIDAIVPICSALKVISDELLIVLGAAYNQISIPGMTIIGSAISSADVFTSGAKTYKFRVDQAEGSIVAQAQVTSDLVTSAEKVVKTIQCSIKASSSTVTNADVLKSIVALIASINKQIQALQKLILARR